ncbi:phosphoenolpyruvate carboxykinase (ATP) [Elysia marginata]|uniref:phosphoenolpyruvate carboxykinase (ATP) n=1 Tax=Elysia marginata TaxID=1093978 RepID=A0AAV4FNQ0_9GAST|nr:phosphoenolpyruvate carboxykinase (ATP) [Elysia marginata]
MGEETAQGVLSVKTGRFTGRAPKDRFIVKDNITKDKIWWGDINIPFDPQDFDNLYNKMVEYLQGREVFVQDSSVCADQRHNKKIRTIAQYPWSAMFAYNMFMRPTEEELENFTPEWTVLNVPDFLADHHIDQTRSANFSILNFTRKIAIIGGTGYPGEIKKGIFSVLNFVLPTFENVFPMHCSANIGEKGDTAIFFGLSGTGKTTLSADPSRALIGDDEHGWTPENRIFNFEGGCYAKVADLSYEKEPDIYRAIKKGAILENVILDNYHYVDYSDTSITLNTRVSYPIHHIDNIQVPSCGENPKNIFFLAADAFGVLPPVSKLTPGQAAYQFISGYTAKVAGTEDGINEPVPSFSACFGAPFMPLHPTVYATMLMEKMKSTGVNVWLINTGWTGGEFGKGGKRMKLNYTRASIHTILNEGLENVEYEPHPVFGLQMPKSCTNVPSEVLNPINTWKNKKFYDSKANHLAKAFEENFSKFESHASEEIKAGSIHK